MFGRHAVKVEERGAAAVAWAQGVSHHRYEDRFRLLTAAVPLVRRSGRGEIVAVFDGMGGLPLGMHAAQVMADGLLRFFREPEKYPATAEGVWAVLSRTAGELRDEAAARKREAGCAGTAAWLGEEGELCLFHAGDTMALRVTERGHDVLTPVQSVEGALSNYFGMPRGLRIETIPETLQPGDWLVLVSDGVTATLDPRGIAELVRASPIGREAAERVARAALDRGTLDDVTALVFEAE